MLQVPLDAIELLARVRQLRHFSRSRRARRSVTRTATTSAAVVEGQCGSAEVAVEGTQQKSD